MIRISRTKAIDQYLFTSSSVFQNVLNDDPRFYAVPLLCVSVPLWAAVRLWRQRSASKEAARPAASKDEPSDGMWAVALKAVVVVAALLRSMM